MLHLHQLKHLLSLAFSFNVFPQYAQDMKLLDFTGRKVDPSLMLGDMKAKKERDPNIKVKKI